MEYHILLTNELGLIENREYEGLARDVMEVKRVLTSVIQKLKADR